MADRERMSSVDTAWLRMDRPYNLMMITGVLMLESRVDFGRLRSVLEKRFASHRRFRQVPVLDATGGWWKTDEQFDVDRHLHRIRLGGRGGSAELKRLAARFAATPLDPSKPLWEFHYVENFLDRSAIVARIHHCYADGIALIGVLLSMTDSSPAPTRAAARIRRAGASRSPGGPLHHLLDPLGELVSGAIRVSENVIDRSVEVFRDPAHLADYARLGGRVAADALDLATMPDDSVSRFKGKPGRKKRVAWCEPIPLDQVKAVGRALGCSVNDVLLSCVAGALRHYLVDKGDAVDGVEVRAMVPVNHRPPGEEARLGNRFGLVPLLLPLAPSNPLARLYEVHRRMDALKGSFLPALAVVLLGAAGVMPKAFQQEMLDFLANKATAVMTNVPGPQQPLYLAGARLGQIMFWVPQSGNIGMGVSVLSFDGGVQLGVITDAGLVPDPERIVEHFAPEFDRLLMTVLMEPWDMQRDPDLVEAELAALVARPDAERKPAGRAAGVRRRAARRSRRSASSRETKAAPAEPT